MTGWLRPPARGVRWRIVEAPAKGALTIWFLGDLPKGVWIHWTGQCCCLCASQSGDPPRGTDCVWCAGGQRREWRGQIPALDPPRLPDKGGTEVVFRFPASLGRDLVALVDRYGAAGKPSLRGVIVDVERCTPRDGGRGVRIREVRGRFETPTFLPTISIDSFCAALYRPANHGFVAGGGVS